MRRFLSLLAASASLLAPLTSPAASYEWANGAADHDFGNFNNWNDATSNHPTTFSGHSFYINLAGANWAEISSSPDASFNTATRLRMGILNGQSGELRVSGGTTLLQSGELQIGQAGTAVLTMTGGTFSSTGSYTTIGQSAGSNGTLNITGGTFNADRITVSNVADTTAALNISGGALNINLSDPTPASTSGSLRMNSGDATIHISGTAVVTCEFLITGNIDGGVVGNGLLTMSGGTLNVIGSPIPAPDTPATLTFPEGGAVAFEGGVWNVKGDETATIAAAIAAGRFHHSQGNTLIQYVYNSMTDTTVVNLRAPTPLEAWRIAYFGSADDSGDGANDADTELDGIKNLIEYGFGLDPTMASLSNLPAPVVGPTTATYSFTEPSGVAGITYGMKTSTNLIDWDPVTDTGSAGAHVFEVPIGPNGNAFVIFSVTED